MRIPQSRRRPWLVLPVLAALAALAAPMALAADPPAREELPRDAARSLVGREVTGPSGAIVGRIVNVLMDENGQPRAAVLDYGGFLGVGRRRVAVAWRSLQFAPDIVRLDITREQMGAVPDYKEGAPVVIAAPPAPGASPVPAEQAPEAEPPVAPAGPPGEGAAGSLPATFVGSPAAPSPAR
jgi:hypothetical protein